MASVRSFLAHNRAVVDAEGSPRRAGATERDLAWRARRRIVEALPVTTLRRTVYRASRVEDSLVADRMVSGSSA